jgi:hypothetical protein
MLAIGFATSTGHPDGHPDDLLAAAELARRGHTVAPAIWDDPGVDWGSFDVVVIRSTWDYWRRRPQFLHWVHRCAIATQLWNPERMVIWNSHKSYLGELGSRGVPVIPTELGTPGETLEELCDRRGWGTVVVKPMVSAAADGAHFVARDQRGAFEASYAAAVATTEHMVQPFVEGVLAPGERSLVYLAGEFSHAFSKGPALPIDLRERSGYQHVVPSAGELDLAERALRAVVSRPLYARVDLVQGEAGSPVLMELELMEPYLHFADSECARARFAEALERQAPG